jgi:hypothetical protein
MPPLARPFATLERWFARRTAALSGPRAPFIAALLVPLIFGLLSLMLGQDDGWDMKNYHLYNAHALLNGRLAVDMAPGNFQSYFNPTLDSSFPGPVASFIFGVLHGLNFVLVLAIARSVLGTTAAEGYRVPLLLAIAGVCGAGFLSELGNTMGDNMTSLLVLAALYMLFKRWDQLRQWSAAAVCAAIASGFVMGLGTGLKLTNATFAVALCLAFFMAPGSLWLRIGLAFVFGVGTLAGIAVTAGWWFMKLWQTFGNPLFPQFNNIFHSPLAVPQGVDTAHLPKTVLETLFWPVVFSFDFTRVSELVLRQTIWPIVYLLFVGVCAHLLYLRMANKGDGGKSALAPRAFPAAVLRHRLSGVDDAVQHLPLSGAGGFAGAPGGVGTAAARAGTGHCAPRRRLDTGLHDAGGVPLRHLGSCILGQQEGWMATFMPKDVSVISLGSGFPETQAYVDPIRGVIASRPGPHYVMLFASKNYKETSMQKKLAIAQSLGLTDSAAACAKLDTILQRVRFQVQMKPLPGAPNGQHCALELQPKYRMDLPALDREVIAAAEKNLANYGLKVNGAACKIYPAAIGADPYPYQLCPVEVRQR